MKQLLIDERAIQRFAPRAYETTPLITYKQSVYTIGHKLGFMQYSARVVSTAPVGNRLCGWPVGPWASPTHGTANTNTWVSGALQRGHRAPLEPLAQLDDDLRSVRAPTILDAAQHIVGQAASQE